MSLSHLTCPPNHPLRCQLINSYSIDFKHLGTFTINYLYIIFYHIKREVGWRLRKQQLNLRFRFSHNTHYRGREYTTSRHIVLCKASNSKNSDHKWSCRVIIFAIFVPKMWAHWNTFFSIRIFFIVMIYTCSRW